MKSVMSLGVIIASVLLMGMVVGASSVQSMVFHTDFSGGIPNWVHTVNATVGTFDGNSHALIVSSIQHDVEHSSIYTSNGVEVGYGTINHDNFTSVSESKGNFTFGISQNMSGIVGMFFGFFAYDYSDHNANLREGTPFFVLAFVSQTNGHLKLEVYIQYANASGGELNNAVSLGGSVIQGAMNLTKMAFNYDLQKTSNGLIAHISFSAYNSPTDTTPYFTNSTTIADLTTNYSIDQLDFKLFSGLYDDESNGYSHYSYVVTEVNYAVVGEMTSHGNGGNNMGGNTNSTGNNTSQNNTSQNNILGTNNYMTVGVIILVSGVVIGVIYYVIRARKH